MKPIDRLASFFQPIYRAKTPAILRCNPLFWITSPLMRVPETNSLVRKLYYGQNPPLFRLSLKCLLFNILSTIKRVFKSSHSNALSGELTITSDFLFVVYLNRGDVEKFIHQKTSFMWGQVPFFLQPKHKVQYLFLPMYELSKEETHSLTKSCSCLFLNTTNWFSFKIFYQFLKLFLHYYPVLTAKLPGVSTKFFALASALSVRSWQSFGIYEELKKRNLSRTKHVFMPWEAQPEHKAICLAFREQNVSVSGYIHSSITDLPYYLYNNGGLEQPSGLLIHGRDMAHTLSKLGWTQAQISEIASIRFQPKANEVFKGKLYLPYDLKTSIKYLALAEPFARAKTLNVAEVKAHPTFLNHPILKPLIDGFPVTAQGEDTVVCGFSTVILEALEAGQTVIQLTQNQEGQIEPSYYPSIEQRQINTSMIELRLKPEHKGHLIRYGESDFSLGALGM